jgi:WD40 repeat protein
MPKYITDVFKCLMGLALLLSVTGCTLFDTGATPTQKTNAAISQLGRPIFTYDGHVNRVTATVWSPDGKYIASGSMDTTVHVWDASVTDHFHLFIYHGHSQGVFALAWSPDGRAIASGSADKTIQVWDPFTGLNRITLNGHSDTITSLSWSPDGKQLASASLDGSVRIWDLTSRQQKYSYSGHTAGVTEVAWSPDGKYIASSSSDKTVHVFNSANGQVSFIFRGHTDTVSSLAWSPDSKRIASGSWDKSAQVWDAANGQVAYAYRGYNPEVGRYNQAKGVPDDLIFFVRWSHDGKRLIAVTQIYCGDSCDVVVFLDATSGNYLGNYQTLPMYAINWSPDDTRLVTGLNLSTARITRAIP